MVWLIFCNLGLKNCWHGRPGIEPITLNLRSQSGANDLSATATPILDWHPDLLFLFILFNIYDSLIIKEIEVFCHYFVYWQNRKSVQKKEKAYKNTGQGGQVGYVMDFHPGIPRLTPAQGYLPIKSSVRYMATSRKAYSINITISTPVSH